ncbi:hypothetical protein SS1G_09410 [Sclerotinia sclerotiorum 1980 UF-70]|uniref:Uncharacterized protein n=1 Tax=Sclerotinia sclerotiorum (strain ATCC 18683 / 1980 / Ss-1) TaxID=665079 RepID=A7EVQ1_SCLS1|nr:hypothetical protein SS1G_09410 [Sclerotinia sclerotiorum 1980 UF-70]EDN93543.1 hypothetical protein SS1G_09410 [Sclerotinia sclerotiorum 1980 UF-70]
MRYALGFSTALGINENPASEMTGPEASSSGGSLWGEG